MSLPIKAIDRLFERLGMTYGKAWSNLWDGMPVQDVKSLWAHELAFYANHLDDVAWALENLPERAPNIIEFRNLCRKAPRKEVLKLDNNKADPERVASELSKLRDALKVKAMPVGDSKEWARIIINRDKAGEKVPATCLRFAREALGVKL